MKQLYLAIIVLAVAASCVSVEKVGQFNMISYRNIDSKLDYSVLSTYSGGSTKERKKTRVDRMEEAVEQTTRKIPGGEYLMNAKVYKITRKPGGKVYWAVEGDVWGIKTNITYRGFKVGDKVIIDGLNNSMATIKSLKDDKTCFIERKNGNIEEIKYDRISKAE